MTKKLIAYLLLMVVTVTPPMAGEVPTSAAVDDLHRYVSECAMTGAGNQPQCTIAVPSTGTKRLFLDTVVVTSAQLVSVAFDRGGTVPTATLGTMIKLNTTVAPQASVYTASNSSGATSTVTLPLDAADIAKAFDMSGEAFARKTAVALTVRPASNMTGSFRVQFFWGEDQ